MALLGFTSGAPCGGRSSFKLTLGASSWAPSVSCWQSTLSRFGAVGLTFTGTTASWSTSTGRWLNVFSGTSMPRRCDYPPVKRSIEWVKRLPSAVAALNVEVTRLIDKKPSDAIKAKTLTQKPFSVVPGRPLGLKEQKVPSGVGVCYLYQPGELEGGRWRATDLVWSLEVYRLGRSVTKPDEPVLYNLQDDDAPQRGFVREELPAVPSDTQLPPDGVLRC